MVSLSNHDVSTADPWTHKPEFMVSGLWFARAVALKFPSSELPVPSCGEGHLSGMNCEL